MRLFSKRILNISLLLVLALALTVPFQTASAASCYVLTTASSPANGGTVNITEAQNCPGGYLSGTVVTLTAVPASDSLFNFWAGATPASSNPVTVTMNSRKTVTAFFRKQVLLNNPSGTNMTTWDNKFHFTGTTGVVYYSIQVQRGTTTIYTKAFQHNSFCSGTTCVYYASEDQFPYLTDGEYSWRISSTVGNVAQWTEYKSFSLSRGLVVLGAPRGRVLGWDKTLYWTGVAGANYYYIQLKKSSPLIINNKPILASSPTYCSGLDCHYTLSLAEQGSVPSGSMYYWRVQYMTGTSKSAFTAWQSFTP